MNVGVNLNVNVRTICVAGAESTGKSWLAGRLASHFGTTEVPEYARAYCAQYGNALSMAQLVHIGAEQDRQIRARVASAAAQHRALVIADTDALVTGVWARFGLGAADPWFDGDMLRADLYLVTDNDLPWMDDGVRIQADLAERDRFRALLIAEVERRGARWLPVGGTGPARLDAALAAMAMPV